MGIGRTFSAPEAAQYLGLNEETLKIAVRRGVIPDAYRDKLRPGGPWRFTKEGLDAYRESRKQYAKPQS